MFYLNHIVIIISHWRTSNRKRNIILFMQCIFMTLVFLIIFFNNPVNIVQHILIFLVAQFIFIIIFIVFITWIITVI